MDMVVRTHYHYSDVIMSGMATQITSLTILYATVYSGADQRKHQRSASLVCVRGIHRWPVNSPHKWPVTLEMFPFDDVILGCQRPCFFPWSVVLINIVWHCKWLIFSSSYECIRRNYNVVMTPKRRRVVVSTSWWRYYCVVRPLGLFLEYIYRHSSL